MATALLYMAFGQDTPWLNKLIHDWAGFAMMPIGFPTKKYGPLGRKPVAEVTFVDGWGKQWKDRDRG